MTSLVTGGSGLVGAELAHLLNSQGDQVVVFDIAKSARLSDIEDKIRFVRGNLSVWSEVFNVVKDHQITHVYHMGAMLTGESEANPWGSFQTNVVGTYNVLEAARLVGVKGMMFTSSIGTFGESLGAELSDVALQRPRDFYGVGKLYCEGLGRMYRRKFGLDFRGLRYPSVVGPGVTTPGHWDAPAIQNVIMGRPVQIGVPPDRASAMIYYKDAARAAYELLNAPAAAIKMINYNVGGIRKVTPKQIEAVLRTDLGQVSVSYVSPPGLPSQMREIAWDDSFARSEWGWSPRFDDINLLVSDFIQEIKKNPRRHGVA